jgi:hypothetical protein
MRENGHKSSKKLFALKGRNCVPSPSPEVRLAQHIGSVLAAQRFSPAYAPLDQDPGEIYLAAKGPAAVAAVRGGSR